MTGYKIYHLTGISYLVMALAMCFKEVGREVESELVYKIIPQR